MGRAGSVGVPGKNVRQVAGRPLVSYPLRAAMDAEMVDRVYVTTDCPQIKAIADDAGAHVIDRPDYLSGPEAQMSDAIVHALEQMPLHPDILVTMHANCGIHNDGLVDDCISALMTDNYLDSCVSVRFLDDCHPYRVKRVCEDGTLVPWVPVPDLVQNNRQEISERAVVLDGAARAIRVSRCLPPSMSAQPPFRYLGNRIGFVVNPGGLDVHTEDDIAATERWIESQSWARYRGRGVLSDDEVLAGWG